MLQSCCLAGPVSSPFLQQIAPDPTRMNHQETGLDESKSTYGRDENLCNGKKEKENQGTLNDNDDDD